MSCGLSVYSGLWLTLHDVAEILERGFLLDGGLRRNRQVESKVVQRPRIRAESHKTGYTGVLVYKHTRGDRVGCRNVQGRGLCPCPCPCLISSKT